MASDPSDNPIPYEQLPDYAAQIVLRDLWRRAANGRYFVYVGAVNWAVFDFTKHEWAVSILIADQGFLKDINPATISFETFHKMPVPEGGEPVGIDPRISAEMKRDIRWVMQNLRSAKYPNSVDHVFGAIHRDSDTLVDVSDGVNKLQGIVATVRVDY